MRDVACLILVLTLLSTPATSRGAEQAAPAKAADPARGGTPTDTESTAPPEAPARSWWSPENLLSLGQLQVNSWRDIFHLGRWGGQLDSSIDGYQQKTRLPDNANSKLTGRLFTNGLTVRNEGFSVLDPRLLVGNIGLRFALQRSDQDADGTRSHQTGELIGYNFDTTLFGEKPYNATLLAGRSQNLTTRLTGGSTQTDNENRAAIFRWREDSILRDRQILPFFSATLEAREDHTKETTTMAGQSFRRDEQRSFIGLTGHNGFETADLDFRLEKTSLDNLVYSSGSYQSRVANIGYSLDFGTDRNARWDSRLNYNSRTGASDISILNINERLAIDHYQNLSTGYYYDFTRQVTPGGTVMTRSGGMTLQHILYQNLTSTLGLSGTQQALPNGSIETRIAQAGFNYAHGIPWSGRLWVALGGSLQVTDNQLQSSLVSVIDAPFEVPQQLGVGTGFLLKDRFVVADSIVVVDVKGGARLPTTPGIDYIVLVEGDQTRILPQPTSAVILPGDLLEVSYSFRLDPSLKFQTTSRSATVTADWQWIAASVSHDENLQKPLSQGDSSFLTNRRRDTARLDLRGSWGTLQARGDATLSHYDYTRLIYNELRVGEHITYSPRENWLATLSAAQSRAVYQLPQRRSEGEFVRLDVDWASHSGWWLTTYVSRQILRDTQVPSEAMTEAAIRLRRTWLKLNVSAMLGLAERTRGSVQTTNVRFQLSAIRRF